MDDGEWQFVSRRRGGARTDRNSHSVSLGGTFAPSFTRYNGKVTPVAQGSDDQDGTTGSQRKAIAESVVAAIEQLRKEVELSDLWEEIQHKLAEAVLVELQSMRNLSEETKKAQPDYVEDGRRNRPSSRGSWPVGDGVAYSLVCLGLGSPTSCSDVLSCRYQLALALLLQKLLRIPSSRVQISDPVMNEVDLQVLDVLSLSSGHGQQAEERQPLQGQQHKGEVELVLYLAPHCDADLYGDILGMELALQPFCSRCFSCTDPPFGEYQRPDANRGLSTSSSPCGSRPRYRGFVLIGNLLSSYEMRRSFFGQLQLDEARPASPVDRYSPPHSERDCSQAAAYQAAERPCDGSVSAAGHELDAEAHPCVSPTRNRQAEVVPCDTPTTQRATSFDGAHSQEAAPETAESQASTDSTMTGCQGTSDATCPAPCHWVVPSRGAFVLLELLSFVSEWPLERPFPAHLRAFNDLAISILPAPRTKMQRAAFWKATLQSLHSADQSQTKKKQRRRQRATLPTA